MTTPLFSTYRQGENRVTATLLAVLQRLSLPNIDRILQTLLGDTAFSLVMFENQPKGRGSIPDARIATGPALWIETKTTRDAVNSLQLKNHLNNLGRGENLLLLTPDDQAPSGIHDTVAWSNFSTLASAVEYILDDESDPPSERSVPTEGVYSHAPPRRPAGLHRTKSHGSRRSTGLAGVSAPRRV